MTNWLDFFGQVLEVRHLHLSYTILFGMRYLHIRQGLSFLHEHNITHISTLNPQKSFMVDIGAGSKLNAFDRTILPVKYYFTNLSGAVKVGPEMTRSEAEASFSRDVRECGVMMDRMLDNVRPQTLIANSLLTNPPIGRSRWSNQNSNPSSSQ